MTFPFNYLTIKFSKFSTKSPTSTEKWFCSENITLYSYFLISNLYYLTHVVLPKYNTFNLGLKDLDQSQEYVRGKIIDYINHLISLGVAGFRVDAAKHMWPEDLSVIFSSVNELNSEYFPSGSKPLFYQEVIDTGLYSE